MHGPQDTARIALACLDLTSLNDGDTEADIVRLAERAAAAPGRVAALCVWPRFVRARPRPCAGRRGGGRGGQLPRRRHRRRARACATPARSSQPARRRSTWCCPGARCRPATRPPAPRCCARCAAPATGLLLKVILETGELRDAGADRARLAASRWPKAPTSSRPAPARRRVGATPEAATRDAAGHRRRCAARAARRLQGRRRHAQRGRCGGLPRPGRAPCSARGALTPARFRIGASALLADIEAVLGGRSSATRRAGLLTERARLRPSWFAPGSPARAAPPAARRTAASTRCTLAKSAKPTRSPAP